MTATPQRIFLKPESNSNWEAATLNNSTLTKQPRIKCIGFSEAAFCVRLN